MKRTSSWDEITNCYRKKPARYKAIQYLDGLLPPDTFFMINPDDNQKIVVHGDKPVRLDVGDWVVLDIETNKTCVLKDDVFNMVFEEG